MISLKTTKFAQRLGLGLAALVPLLTSVPVMAASATESLVLSGSATKGSTFHILIKENSGSEPVNAATANLSYPTDKLSYVSTTNSNAFSITAATSGGSGSVKIDRGAYPAVTGSQTIATVNFKALTDTGTATISITGGSIYSANNNANIYSGGSGTSVALKPAPVSAPAAPADTIPPKITGLTISEITASGATIAWTTSEPATSEVIYGPSQNYGLSDSDSQLVTDHKIVLKSPLISPVTLYHLTVKSVDNAGNATTSPDVTFTTKGASLLATVTSKSNKKLSGAKVTFGTQTAITDKTGTVIINDLPLGKQTGTIIYKGKTTAISVDLAATAFSTPQKYTFKVDTPGSMLWIAWLVILLLLLEGLILKRSTPLRVFGRLKTKVWQRGNGIASAATPTDNNVDNIIHPDKKS
jgi:hypothetical protein